MSIDKIKLLTDSLTRVEENLKEEMAILEFILEKSTDGYWDWNIVTNYEYLSPKFKAQLGYTPDEMENSPRSWQSICNPDDLEKAIEHINSHLKGETSDFSETLRFTHKAGHIVTILCSGVVVSRDKDGNPLRMVGTHRLI
jgi:PAS domain S-box-containing protein